MRLTDQCVQLVEFTDGYVEELPKPTSSHQAVLLFLYRLFHEHLKPLGGVVMVLPLRMRIRDGKYREPDILVLCDRSDERYQDRYWLGADIVVEVVKARTIRREIGSRSAATTRRLAFPSTVSPTPQLETITVLALCDGSYAEHGVFGRGERAASSLLDGLRVDVAAALDATDA